MFSCFQRDPINAIQPDTGLPRCRWEANFRWVDGRGRPKCVFLNSGIFLASVVAGQHSCCSRAVTIITVITHCLVVLPGDQVTVSPLNTHVSSLWNCNYTDIDL